MGNQDPSRKRNNGRRLAVAALAAGVLLAGCGADKESPQRTTTGSSSISPDPKTKTAPEKAPQPRGSELKPSERASIARLSNLPTHKLPHLEVLGRSDNINVLSADQSVPAMDQAGLQLMINSVNEFAQRGGTHQMTFPGHMKKSVNYSVEPNLAQNQYVIFARAGVFPGNPLHAESADHQTNLGVVAESARLFISPQEVDVLALQAYTGNVFEVLMGSQMKVATTPRDEEQISIDLGFGAASAQMGIPYNIYKESITLTNGNESASGGPDAIGLLDRESYRVFEGDILAYLIPPEDGAAPAAPPARDGSSIAA